MANNRMFIRCKVCGRGYMLAKSWGVGWSVWPDDIDDIQRFINEHETCGFYENGEFGEENFDICYELSMTNEEEKRISGRG